MQIRIYGDKILRKKCLLVKAITDKERQIFDQMVAKMREHGGVGLAASQVGLNKQMLVVAWNNEIFRLANPKICKRQGKQAVEEGCLSVPEVVVKVKRAKRIALRALNDKNEAISFAAEDVLAVILQHEIDHLKGRLIIDYLPWHKRIAAIKKLKERAKSK
jgi:peptide deformylase